MICAGRLRRTARHLMAAAFTPSELVYICIIGD